MAFFAVERRADGLRLPLAETYPTRESAVKALGELLSAGEIAPDADLFVVDLDAATPVLVLGSVAPVPVFAPDADAIAPMADVSEDGVLPSGAAEVAPEPEDAPGEEPAAEASIDWQGSLAEALKRAATSLESEGIVAAVPVPVDEPFAAPVEASSTAEEVPGEDEVSEIARLESDGTTAPSDEVIDLGAGRPVTVVAEPRGVTDDGDAAVPSSGEGLAATWPWANVESYDTAGGAAAEAGSPEPEPAAVPAMDADADDVDAAEVPTVEEILSEIGDEEPLALTYRTLAEDLPAYEEPARVESSLIPVAPPEGEDAFLPSPVILGDYGDDVSSRVDVAAEPIGEAADDALAAFDGLAAATPSDEGPSYASTPDEAAAPVAGYESSDALDLAAYTCNDCVYSNTCPKVGQVTPAECGSFQWKSA